MPRTPSQQRAAERDGRWCLWCKYHRGRLVPATDVHHLAGRQPGGDRPELCLSLCHSCHLAGTHNGRSPTKADLVDLVYQLYGLDLRRRFPRFFGHLRRRIGN